ncbi:hypothetical protein BC832DRAFT_551209 [Gaertneriomyces semiglobifer]|nr:hypothetical protein BC832DRAFT_551209 [Gaertneriomyces semiglobifer]
MTVPHARFLRQRNSQRTASRPTDTVALKTTSYPDAQRQQPTAQIETMVGKAGHVPEKMEISPMPVIDSDLDVYDRSAVLKSRDAFFQEQMVRIQEINVLKDKLRWCYYREGVNHMQNCRNLSEQYLDMMREMRTGWIKPFKLSEIGNARKNEQTA